MKFVRPTLLLPLSLIASGTLASAQGALIEFSANQRAIAEDVNENFRTVNNKAEAAASAANLAGAAIDTLTGELNGLSAQVTPLSGALSVTGSRVQIGPASGVGATLAVDHDGPGHAVRVRNLDSTGNSSIEFPDLDGSFRSAIGFANLDNTAPWAGNSFFLANGGTGLVLATNNGERMRVTGTGNVGIGTTNPTDRLHVSGGDLRVDSNRLLQFGDAFENTDAINFTRVTFAGTNVSGLDLNLGDDPNPGSAVDFFRIRASGQDRFVFRSDGLASKPDGGSWASFSDRRLKRDIEPLSGALDSLLRLRGTTFHYKDPEAHGASAGRKTGFIAQEVETVFPEWVTEGSDGMKMVAISGFEALTVESLRELDARNRELEQANEALQRRVEELEALARRVAALESSHATVPAAAH